MSSDVGPSTFAVLRRQLYPGQEISRTVKDADTLVVLCHGYTLDPSSLQTVADVVRNLIPSSDILGPDLHVKNPFCTTNPDRVVEALTTRIELAWKERGEYQRVILVGHSFGALIARKAYAEGLLSGAVWAQRVERIILLAAMNRGWEFSHHLTIPTFLAWKVGSAIGRIQEYCGRKPLIFSIRRGGRFITGLQLLWLKMEQEGFSRGERPATTIQLLGSTDDIVAPEDNVDLVTGGNFVYLDVPHSAHADIVEMDDSTFGKGRRAVFSEALVEDSESLRRRSIHPADSMGEAPRFDVTDVVFVLHGIRDVGYWTHKIARMVQREGASANRIFATVTASYGYFPMLPFLLPSRRRQKVQWLVDQYVAAKARYPRAEFSFVGHSHGTYLLARALQDYSDLSFKRVVFAGSVVLCQYPWPQQISRGRVSEILNYVADADWVVAFFPKLFQLLRLQDLGAAGHDGFYSSDPSLLQVEYLRGQHSAALIEDNWRAIAHYIVHGGHATLETGCPIRPHRNRFIETLGKAPYVVWALAVALIIYGGWKLVSLEVGSPSLFELASTHHSMPLKVFIVAIYLWVIKGLLTKL